MYILLLDIGRSNLALLRLNTVKAHKSGLLTKERDLAAREAALAEREAKLVAVLTQKDEELASLRNAMANAETMLHQRVRAAVTRREGELRAMAVKQEEEVAARMTLREQEIMEAVRRREEEMSRMWTDWEHQIRGEMTRAVEERMQWIQGRADELERERERLVVVERELEARKAAQTAPAPERRTRSKNPLEEVKNIMAPLSRLADSPEPVKVAPPQPCKLPVFETPMPTKSLDLNTDIAPPSAMKGVILTATGEPVATPTPAELAKLFVNTPKVGLNFAKIFDFDAEESGSESELDEDGYETDSRPRASQRGGRSSASSRSGKSQDSDGEHTPTQSSTTSSSTSNTASAPAVRPTRLRRPSIRAASASAAFRPVTVTESAPSSSSSGSARAKMHRAASTSAVTSSAAAAMPSSAAVAEATALGKAPAPQYDMNDVENLPSPFLKKVEDRVAAPPSKPKSGPRKSGTMLRAVAAMNSAKAGTRSASAASASTASSGSSASLAQVRSSVAKAQSARIEARKTLEKGMATARS